MIRIAPNITIDEAELDERFIRASGPGGQNVNKLSTAVQLRFDPSRLDPAFLERLAKLAGTRMTKEGVLVINAQRFRTQERNRQDARDRLADLLRRAAVVPRTRRATRPTKASKIKRLDEKTRRGGIKALRRPQQRDD